MEVGSRVVHGANRGLLLPHYGSPCHVINLTYCSWRNNNNRLLFSRLQLALSFLSDFLYRLLLAVDSAGIRCGSRASGWSLFFVCTLNGDRHVPMFCLSCLHVLIKESHRPRPFPTKWPPVRFYLLRFHFALISTCFLIISRLNRNLMYRGHVIYFN